MDKQMDDLLADIAEFLQQEQEMYGSLPFPVLRQKKTDSVPERINISNSNRIETESGKSDPESGGNPFSGSKTEISGHLQKPLSHVNDHQTGSNPAEPGSGKNETIPAQKEISGADSEEALPGSLKHRLEQAATLEQLKRVCAEADELKTDLPETRLVFGVGNPDADLMLIGEAPGEQEDLQGEPFVGAAGQLLNKILAAIQFNREDVYIANILKHRPPGNRNPSPEERLRSLPYLLKQIDLIQPKVILCLGKVSATTLLNREDSLKSLRGEFYPFRNSLLTVTYHPAALLRNPQWKRPTWEDVQKVRAKYDELTNS